MKEEKSILNLYLAKVAAGDLSCLAKLVRRLADRLLFIPVRSTSSDGGGSSGKMKINVYTYQSGEREVVPVFTTEKNLKSWCQSVSGELSNVSLLGADLCAALGSESTISVDEGSDHAVVFEPDVIVQIAATPTWETEEKVHEAPILLTPEQIIAPAQAHSTATAEDHSTQTVQSSSSKIQDWD